jgi:hypothetical protein
MSGDPPPLIFKDRSGRSEGNRKLETVSRLHEQNAFRRTVTQTPIIQNPRDRPRAVRSHSSNAEYPRFHVSVGGRMEYIRLRGTRVVTAPKKTNN